MYNYEFTLGTIVRVLDPSNGMFRSICTIIDRKIKYESDGIIFYYLVRDVQIGKDRWVKESFLEKVERNYRYMPVVNNSKISYENFYKTTKDDAMSRIILNSVYGLSTYEGFELFIDKVIYNDPATIVMWKDGSKTVVKTCNGEAFDPEKGLAMAMSKKILGNRGNYYNTFKKWLPKETEEE